MLWTFIFLVSAYVCIRPLILRSPKQRSKILTNKIAKKTVTARRATVTSRSKKSSNSLKTTQNARSKQQLATQAVMLSSVKRSKGTTLTNHLNQDAPSLDTRMHPPNQKDLKPTHAKSELRYENALGLARSLKFSEALKILNILIQDDPLFWKAQLTRAQILNELGKSHTALESCEAVLRQQPNCLTAYDEQAKAQMSLRDYPGAIISLSRLLKQLPSPRNFEQRAIAHKGLGHWNLAIIDTQKALQLYQQRQQVHQVRRLTSELENLFRNRLSSQFHKLDFQKVQRKAKVFPFEQGSAHLRNKLLRLLNRDQAQAKRLLADAKQKHPTKSVDWCFEKVIYNLERDRSR